MASYIRSFGFKFLSGLAVLFCIAATISAEVIDVSIKGVDDGIKTKKQQDYKEAVMNAKLQAIERAGASIESITKVVNFQLKYDQVESKSSAILLPGFQIIDIGYIADGTLTILVIIIVQFSFRWNFYRESLMNALSWSLKLGTMPTHA